MAQNEQETFRLEIFEGPLSFLLHLIQKSEIDIHDIPIHEITAQYLHRLKDASFETGAEFIGAASILMWMKSKRLLPKHEPETEIEEEMDASFEIIYKLLEYCRFKEAAKHLATREESQNILFGRGVHSLPEPKKQLGIEHLTSENLSDLFREILARSKEGRGKIHEETWRVSDKILQIRRQIKEGGRIAFGALYSTEKGKEELIVTFLAMLELMKIGDCFVGRETGSGTVFIYEGSYDAGNA